MHALVLTTQEQTHTRVRMEKTRFCSHTYTDTYMHSTIIDIVCMHHPTHARTPTHIYTRTQHLNKTHRPEARRVWQQQEQQRGSGRWVGVVGRS